MASKIEEYLAAWHTGSDQGRVRLKLKNGKTKNWSGSAADFTAIVAILEASDSPYLTSDGWISTGSEEPGY